MRTRSSGNSVTDCLAAGQSLFQVDRAAAVGCAATAVERRRTRREAIICGQLITPPDTPLAIEIQFAVLSLDKKVGIAGMVDQLSAVSAHGTINYPTTREPGKIDSFFASGMQYAKVTPTGLPKPDLLAAVFHYLVKRRNGLSCKDSLAVYGRFADFE